MQTQTPTNRHILIIGGAGYIGSVLSRKLLQTGYQVRILDPLIYGNGASVADLLIDERFSFINGDFGIPSDLEVALDGITDVILLASLVGDSICKKYPELAVNTNLEYPKALLETLQGKGIKRFIFSSTCSNYGLIENDLPASETAILNPQSLYAETKVSFEKHILSQLSNLDFCPTILRISTAFGISNRMRFDLTVSQFTRDLALGEKLLVYDENTWRPYCHVVDISRAMIAILESEEDKVKGEIFNVGGNTGNFTKQMIVNLVEKNLTHSEVEYREGDFDPRNYRVSFDKIQKVLGFEPTFSVESSIKNLISALKNGFFQEVESRKNFYGNYTINEK